MTRLIAAAALTALLLSADLTKIEAEPNLEKRSELAIIHADEELTVARKAYEAGEVEPFQTAMEEVAQLTELSLKSLEDTGKRARRSPRYWKRAEQRLLGLMRRLDSFEKSVSIDDRAAVESARKRVSDVHDAIVDAIMTKK